MSEEFRAALEKHRATIAEAKEHLGDVAGELRGGLVRYLDLGVEPGSFLCSVIDNDLCGAMGRCSDLYGLRALCSFVFNRFPANAWGSKEKRLAWQERVSALVATPSESEPPTATEEAHG